MTSSSEQFSAVRQSQWESQLDIFRKLSSRALDNTEQLIALNMRTSRASLEQATGAVRQMLEAREPRDLLAIGSNAQDQWRHLFDYGRELLGIATGMRGTWSTLPPMATLPALSAPLRLIPAPSANLPASPSQAAEQAAIAAADAATVAGEITAAAADIGSAMVEAVASAAPAPAAAADAPAAEEAAPAATVVEPASPAEAALSFADAAADTAIADDVPPLEATPLAQALNDLAPKPAGVEHPIVSTVPLEAANGAIELPAVAPVEHAAPPAPAARPPRASRKK
jgi:hypothetical protein